MLKCKIPDLPVSNVAQLHNQEHEQSVEVKTYVRRFAFGMAIQNVKQLLLPVSRSSPNSISRKVELSARVVET